MTARARGSRGYISSCAGNRDNSQERAVERGKEMKGSKESEEEKEEQRTGGRER
jgi:hypothetical protein